MATTLDDIQTTNWQLSLAGPGQVVTDIEDVKQCMLIALTTIKGQDRFRPTFGSDFYKYIDQPQTSGAPAMVKEILNTVGAWETRVVITKISYTFDGNKINFQITITMVANSEQAELSLYLLRTNQPLGLEANSQAFSSGFSLAFS